ncbi:hypothetical protein QQ39_02070 [Pragia fontium]|nr:hypothetical protein QQ39_02070 [Pragia fontium]
MGGINLYQYAPNPLTWSDPLGLSVIDNYKTAKTLSEPEVLRQLQNKYPSANFEILEQPRSSIQCVDNSVKSPILDVEIEWLKLM